MLKKNDEDNTEIAREFIDALEKPDNRFLYDKVSDKFILKSPEDLGEVVDNYNNLYQMYKTGKSSCSTQIEKLEKDIDTYYYLHNKAVRKLYNVNIQIENMRCCTNCDYEKFVPEECTICNRYSENKGSVVYNFEDMWKMKETL